MWVSFLVWLLIGNSYAWVDHLAPPVKFFIEGEAQCVRFRIAGVRRYLAIAPHLQNWEIEFDEYTLLLDPITDPWRKKTLVSVDTTRFAVTPTPISTLSPCKGVIPLHASSELWRSWKYASGSNRFVVLANDYADLHYPIRGIINDDLLNVTWVLDSGKELGVLVDWVYEVTIIPPCLRSEVIVLSPTVIALDIHTPFKERVEFRQGSYRWGMDPSLSQPLVLGRHDLDRFQWFIDRKHGNIHVFPTDPVALSTSQVQRRTTYVDTVLIINYLLISIWWYYKQGIIDPRSHLVSSLTTPFAYHPFGFVIRSLKSRQVLVGVVSVLWCFDIVAIFIFLVLYQWERHICYQGGLCIPISFGISFIGVILGVLVIICIRDMVRLLAWDTTSKNNTFVEFISWTTELLVYITVGIGSLSWDNHLYIHVTSLLVVMIGGVILGQDALLFLKKKPANDDPFTGTRWTLVVVLGLVLVFVSMHQGALGLVRLGYMNIDSHGSKVWVVCMATIVFFIIPIMLMDVAYHVVQGRLQLSNAEMAQRGYREGATFQLMGM